MHVWNLCGSVPLTRLRITAVQWCSEEWRWGGRRVELWFLSPMKLLSLEFKFNDRFSMYFFFVYSKICQGMSQVAPLERIIRWSIVFLIESFRCMSRSKNHLSIIKLDRVRVGSVRFFTWWWLIYSQSIIAWNGVKTWTKANATHSNIEIHTGSPILTTN